MSAQIGRYRKKLTRQTRLHTRDDLQALMTPEYVAAFGYPAWWKFCSEMMYRGFSLELYESHSTKSKYIYVTRDFSGKQVKVRVSDHMTGSFDADFWIGPGPKNTPYRRWIDTLRDVLAVFKEK